MERNIGFVLMIAGWSAMILTSIFMPPTPAKVEAKLLALTVIVIGLQLAAL
jgi:hypothetical protein